MGKFVSILEMKQLRNIEVSNVPRILQIVSTELSGLQKCCCSHYTMLKHLGSCGCSCLAFVIEDIHLPDGEGCSCGFTAWYTIPLCTDNLSHPSLSLEPKQLNKLTQIQNPEQKCCLDTAQLVENLINSFNCSLKGRGGISSLLKDKGTEPNKVQMTCVSQSLRKQ